MIMSIIPHENDRWNYEVIFWVTLKSLLLTDPDNTFQITVKAPSYLQR